MTSDAKTQDLALKRWSDFLPQWAVFGLSAFSSGALLVLDARLRQPKPDLFGELFFAFVLACAAAFCYRQGSNRAFRESSTDRALKVNRWLASHQWLNGAICGALAVWVFLRSPSWTDLAQFAAQCALIVVQITTAAELGRLSGSALK